MPAISTADHRTSPPLIDIPVEYNAAYDLLQRNLQAGRADKTAYIDDNGSCTYGELDLRTNAFANLLEDMGLQMEQRVLLCLHDTIDFPTTFLGAIKAGVIPVPVNTLLTEKDYEFMLNDSRARVAVVSAPLLAHFAPLLSRMPYLERILVSGEDAGADSLADLLRSMPEDYEPAPTLRDEPCFWLYSSGSTGAPKGTVHVHSSLIQTAELYARPILGINENDVVFSAAKLFFAYGLGNALTFPMSVGATTVLMAERPTPSAVAKRLLEHGPTVFCAVPTLFASMLASPELPAHQEVRLRICTSAGEALPEEISRRWRDHFDSAEILDGIGSTELLHIYISNRRGDIHYGTTGTPVPGYDVRLVDEQGQLVPPGEVGELQVSGPTSAAFYWNNRIKSRNTFQGSWTRTGDKYRVDEQGCYVYAGRSDDMLKVSGIYVSPSEVEAALIRHEAVLEAAVVGASDQDGLIKPKAYVVLKSDCYPTPELADELKRHVKSVLAPYKYPRWFEFIDELPKTATGKIQRFKLRAASAQPAAVG